MQSRPHIELVQPTNPHALRTSNSNSINTTRPATDAP